jgi:DNA polymerase/3'-5' exonuclease PolX
MVEEPGMTTELSQARVIARTIREELEPFCDRIEIAGSIRRRCPHVGDIEIVAIPKRVTIDLLGEESVPHPAFCDLVYRWPAVKGRPDGRYTQRVLPEGINLDLFMATPDNWGLILAIRTGSAAYSHQVLARGWVRSGYTSVGGMLVRDYGSPPVPVREEEDLFRLIGLDWSEPWQRNL